MVKKKPRNYLLDIKRGICPNCGQPGPHYVPPALGDPGFFACEALNKPR